MNKRYYDLIGAVETALMGNQPVNVAATARLLRDVEAAQPAVHCPQSAAQVHGRASRRSLVATATNPAFDAAARRVAGERDRHEDPEQFDEMTGPM